jgi:monoamine oxidase
MPEPDKELDLLVIGSGVAGLAAAQEAKKVGASFQILEAQRRIGGRILTAEHTPGLTTEMGAEWIDTSHREIQKIVNQNNLELVEHNFSDRLIFHGQAFTLAKDQYSPGALETLTDFAKNISSLSPTDRNQLVRTSYQDFLKSHGFSDIDILLEGRYKCDVYGEDIAELPALSVLEDISDGIFEEEDQFRIVGGNDRLVRAMATGLEDNIYLNKKVGRIDQADGVTVYTADGEKFKAKKVITTVPTSAVLGIDWAPKLPEKQAEALRKLKYAQIMKLSAVFKKRVWDRDDFAVFTDSIVDNIYHATQNQDGDKGVLTAYIVGENAGRLARMRKADQIQEFNEALRPLFGDVREYIESIHPVNWGDNPFSRGAYSVFHSGYARQRRLMAEPHGNVYFAGEHLPKNFAYQGYMEGAIRSAQEATKLALANS